MSMFIIIVLLYDGQATQKMKKKMYFYIYSLYNNVCVRVSDASYVVLYGYTRTAIYVTYRNYIYMDV